jgi:hypothetical protein
MRLRQRIVKFKELGESDKVELRQLQADREALVRVVHQLTVEIGNCALKSGGVPLCGGGDLRS